MRFARAGINASKAQSTTQIEDENTITNPNFTSPLTHFSDPQGRTS